MMNDDFRRLVDQYGQSGDPVFLDAGRLGACRERLPGSLVDFWQEAGLGSWGGGAFQFCQPEHYVGIVQTVFGGDPQLHPDECAVFGYEVFGRLHSWHRTLGKVQVDLPFGDVEAKFTGNEKQLKIIRRLGPDRVVPVSLLSVVERSDIKDEGSEPMFACATRALGAPGRDECFDFVPALGLGGAREMKYLRRVRAPEHFSILAGPDLPADGVVRWRCCDLQGVIAAGFGVAVHERTVGKLLRRLRLTRLQPRPYNPKRDKTAQTTLKRLRRPRSGRPAAPGSWETAGNLVRGRGPRRPARHFWRRVERDRLAPRRSPRRSA